MQKFFNAVFDGATYCSIMLLLFSCAKDTSDNIDMRVEQNRFLPYEPLIEFFYEGQGALSSNSGSKYNELKNIDGKPAIVLESWLKKSYWSGETEVRFWDYYVTTKDSIFLKGFRKTRGYITPPPYQTFYDAEIIFDEAILLWHEYHVKTFPDSRKILNIKCRASGSGLSKSPPCSAYAVINYYGMTSSETSDRISKGIDIDITISANVNGVKVNWIHRLHLGEGIGHLYRLGGTLVKHTGTDQDIDGILDVVDHFPNDPLEFMDTDNDGLGNIIDPDDDNDNISDEEDQYPLTKTTENDIDGDGIDNENDNDIDNDGLINENDDFPMDRFRF